MKRLGALVAAVILVAVALWVRGRLGGDGITLGSGPATGTIACATEVLDACEAIRAEHPELEIYIEATGATTDGLVAARPDVTGEFDVWLAPQISAAVAAELLEASSEPSPLGTPSKPIAHSRLGLYVHQTRAPVLAGHCGGTVGWGCLLSAVSTGSWQAIGGDPSWGPVKPHLDPQESSGVLALGGAAVGVLPTPVDGAAIRDNATFAGALASLKRARVLTGQASFGALLQMLAVGPSVADVVVALESARNRIPAPAASKATLLYPAPVVSAEIVVVPRRGSENAEDLVELLTGDAGKEALTSTGWESGAAPAARKSSPSVGSHIVLRQIWEEIR